MKKKNTKNTDLSIFNKWSCKLPLESVCLNYNELHKTKMQSEKGPFKIISQKKIPYLVKSSTDAKSFVKSFYEVQLFEKHNVIKHQLTLAYEENNKAIPESLYRDLKLRDFVSLVDYSIVAIQIQRNNERLSQLASELSNRWKVPVGINGYFTPGNSQTLPLHFDNHDVFILQVCGTKKWQVFDTDAKSKSQKVILEKVLKPGDMLFIPTGYFHQAVSEDETSFHMTFGFHMFPERVVSEWLKRRFGQDVDNAISKRELKCLNYLYFFYRYPDNFQEAPFLIFENKSAEKIVMFIEGHEIHLNIRYKSELKNLLKKKEVTSKPMLKLRDFLQKEKII